MGTVLDVLCIVAGTAVGATMGDRISNRIRELLLAGIGLFIVVLGIQQSASSFEGAFAQAIGSGAPFVVLGALIAGGAAGGLLNVEGRIEQLGSIFEKRFSASGESGFLTGFLAATLLFCVGPMAILGAFENGITGSIRILAVKSLMDGFASLAFASSLGWGVAFSSLPLAVYQGGLTAFAAAIGGAMDPAVVASMTAIGGILVLGVGIRLLEIKDIAVANLLPAIVLGPAITAVWLALRH
ncbi:DUF554 domain-containing protein [Streptacidiphilus sp. P02-A3a]|uniref:DUF554 domain-containing protein n=1 Tax=Streptacidiphilus sp. P02-A3a TaxID=2704468 RepID=UPI0015FD72F3|nr:DUF554 domain-containing protein [Streptacidiphilus sp. P02-A3a]QMU69984.1 DUF554 domain-containing protein [Streptacidiphilus sp. P02-A3a]